MRHEPNLNCRTAVVPHPVKHLHGLWFKMIKHCIKWNKSRCLADKPCSMHHKPALLHSLTAACYVVWKRSAGRTHTGFCVLLSSGWISNCAVLRPLQWMVIVWRPDSGALLTTAERTCRELGATSPTGLQLNSIGYWEGFCCWDCMEIFVFMVQIIWSLNIRRECGSYLNLLTFGCIFMIIFVEICWDDMIWDMIWYAIYDIYDIYDMIYNTIWLIWYDIRHDMIYEWYDMICDWLI